MLTVTQIWRYPVKSTGGEQLAEVRVEDGGLAGDRRWAVVDEVSGQVVSAKRDARLLYTWAGTTRSGEVTLGVPGLAEPVPVDDSGRAADAVSAWLGRRVILRDCADRPDGIAFDFGFPVATDAHSYSDCGDVIHVVTERDLAHLAELAGTTTDETLRRTRPNLVLAETDTETVGSGQRISFGTARLQILGPTPRCVMVDRAQPGLPARDLLDDLRERSSGRLGWYALVEQEGRVAVDDRGHPTPADEEAR